ncbi:MULTISPECIES: flavodoxin [Treponema]|jgi:flavodoxin short chain|uniref:Flavodoxin n=1 Tax=Treponema rectale TaxID=744512 RepID=A0A840SIB4_9SPIR|nr:MULTISPECIES: flavodoxin [Treponema]MBB5219646.1 flavodoxin short chain [Treponema rectale]MBE6353803.1 flavodoxin [Treponema sp.]MBO6176104.1 flavodoxin [Treponema sp.]
MKKAVIYASTTGNTEAMANAVAEGVKESGAELVFAQASEADAAEVASCDVIILGSPAMGDEVLEDSMEDFYAGLEPSLSSKKVAVFGSYDWGDGQWLRTWTERLSAAGAVVLNGEGLKAQLTPDEAALAECKELGKIS